MAEESPQATEQKKIRLRAKWLESRNFWVFFVSSTFATIVFIYHTYKCRNLDGTFDHAAADRYYSTWGETITLFWVVFVANNVLKNFINRKSKQSPDEAVD